MRPFRSEVATVRRRRTRGGAAALPAQPAYTPTAENFAARARFQDMRFGLFIHWGVYSLSPGRRVGDEQPGPHGATSYETLARSSIR